MRSSVSLEKIVEEARLRCLVEELEEKKNTMWKQRAHVWWLVDGDQNTRYFHLVASGRMKTNRIIELRSDDGSVMDE